MENGDGDRGKSKMAQTKERVTCKCIVCNKTFSVQRSEYKKRIAYQPEGLSCSKACAAIKREREFRFLDIKL
jgi:hypothetical protein